MYYRPVVPGCAGGAMAPPNFGRSVNPILIKGGRLCPPNNTGTRKFSDLPTALCNSNQVKVVTAYFQHIHFFAPSHLKICKAKVGTQYLAL